MAKITAIKQQKRSSRVNVFIDEKFAFGLSKKTLVDFDLYKGKVLTKKEIDEILEKDQSTKALEKSFRWLGIRPRSKKELENKLKEKGFAPKIIKNTIKRLKELGYLDDKKFAQSWLEARKLSEKGKYIVQHELKQKGISHQIIKKTLEKYSKKDEIEIARQLVEKKIKTLKKDISFKKQKLARFLVSRGFSWEVINEVLRNY
ncbi:MAG: RecX family transcriptional regulator [Patescibacteria group bacterium]